MNETQSDAMSVEYEVTGKLGRMLLITLPIVLVFAVFFIVDFCLFHRKKERSRKYRHLFEEGPRNRVGHSAFPGDVPPMMSHADLVRSTALDNTMSMDNNGTDSSRPSHDVKVTSSHSGVHCSLASQSQAPHHHSDPDISNASLLPRPIVTKKPKPEMNKPRRHLPFMLALFARNQDEQA